MVLTNTVKNKWETGRREGGEGEDGRRVGQRWETEGVKGRENGIHRRGNEENGKGKGKEEG